MTLTSTPPTEAAEPKLSAAELARARRERRNAKIAGGAAPPLHGSSPVFSSNRITARQVPFVAVLVALLGAGLAGVLWLNTLTDEAGIRTNKAKVDAAAAQLTIEGLESDIAVKSATPALAAAAAALGLVPAGDAAIMVLPTDGGDPTIIGTPTAVPDPVAVAAQAKAAADAAAAKAVADAQAVAAKAVADAQIAAEKASAEAAAQAAAASAAAASSAQQAAAGTAGQTAGDTATQPAADAATAPVGAPSTDSSVAVPTTDAVATPQGAAG